MLICGEENLVKLTEIPAPDFDLATTLDSGQVFHWEKIDHGFCGTIGDQAVYVEQVGDVLKVGCADTARPLHAGTPTDTASGPSIPLAWWRILPAWPDNADPALRCPRKRGHSSTVA